MFLRYIADLEPSRNIQTTYSFNVSDAVVEAVVGLEVRVASVPLWVNVSLRPRVSQEIMCLSRADAYVTFCEWKEQTYLSLNNLGVMDMYVMIIVKVCLSAVMTVN